MYLYLISKINKCSFFSLSKFAIRKGRIGSEEGPILGSGQGNKHMGYRMSVVSLKNSPADRPEGLLSDTSSNGRNRRGCRGFCSTR